MAIDLDVMEAKATELYPLVTQEEVLLLVARCRAAEASGADCVNQVAEGIRNAALEEAARVGAEMASKWSTNVGRHVAAAILKLQDQGD